MPKQEITSKESRIDRISKEVKRLRLLLKHVQPERLKVAEGIISRIAFMRITLEDLEDDINQNGTYESFSQHAGYEYDRERPAAKTYNTTIKNYTTSCKQLMDMLPQSKNDGLASEDEKKFLQFIKGGLK